MRFFLETWQHLDRVRRDEASGKPGEKRPSRVDRAKLSLLIGPALLVLMEYAGSDVAFQRVFCGDSGCLSQGRAELAFARLLELGWWIGWRVIGFFILPMFFLVFSRRALSHYGLSAPRVRAHLGFDALVYLAVLPLIFAASHTDAFRMYYPFYELAGRSIVDLVVWECLYAVQFVALEFFFRGWWLHECARSMGSLAVFVVTVPYCMIHFGKPWPETLLAIGAGVFLGTLAAKTRSIWHGVFIHIAVAWTMDLLAIVQTTGLPTRLLPGP